jgi:phosphate starvation-inducible PhoH-like protein
MFLTRLGFNSVAVVTGDITQSDLGSDARSGLAEALEILRDVDGIGFTSFTEKDVVRHPLVQSIVRAYDRAEVTAKQRRDAEKASPRPSERKSRETDRLDPSDESGE